MSNSAIARRFFDEIWSAGHFELVDELIAPTTSVIRPRPSRPCMARKASSSTSPGSEKHP